MNAFRLLVNLIQSFHEFMLLEESENIPFKLFSDLKKLEDIRQNFKFLVQKNMKNPNIV